jgi:hypothetical protein
MGAGLAFDSMGLSDGPLEPFGNGGRNPSSENPQVRFRVWDAHMSRLQDGLTADYKGAASTGKSAV